MSLNKEQIETAALLGYHDIEVVKRGGAKATVRLLLPRIKDLEKVLSPNILDESERMKLFIESPAGLDVNDLTYSSESELAEAIKDFFDLALSKLQEKQKREEVLGGAVARQLTSMASLLAEWQQKLQPETATASNPSAK